MWLGKYLVFNIEGQSRETVLTFITPITRQVAWMWVTVHIARPDIISTLKTAGSAGCVVT